MSPAIVHRNKETGEFSCMVGYTVLLKAKIASGIKRVHDMVDAINSGFTPEISSEGRGDKRRFTVTIGDFVFVSGMSAHGGYRELDKLEAVLRPVVGIVSPGYSRGIPDTWGKDDDNLVAQEALAAMEMPAVPVPDSADPGDKGGAISLEEALADEDRDALGADPE